MKLNLDTYEMCTKQKECTGPFINREVSWIGFNERVLACALRNVNPLNERLKFLAITDSNLDEFIGVRFSYSYRKNDEYERVLNLIKSFVKSQNDAYLLLKSLLLRKKVIITSVKKLDKNEQSRLYEEYMENIFPILTPYSVDLSNPDLLNGQVCVAVNISSQNTDSIVVIPIPKDIDPIIQIKDKIVFIEDVVKSFCEKSLFINKTVTAKCVFRIIRDQDIELEHDSSKFIIDRMNDSINRRRMGQSLFIEVTKKSDEELVNRLIVRFSIPRNHLVEKDVIEYKRFMSPLVLGEKESYEKFESFSFEQNNTYYSLFEAISEKDILLHHPYDSYETVVKFIQHAAVDKDVVCIKQTLYRVSSVDSPIVDALCTAAKNGKKVTVLIEIKARFDEENNLKLVNKLEYNGVHVILGHEYIKTHAKMCIVVRRENNKLKVYSHIATGNYNEKTSKLYTDLSFFTKKYKIGLDLLHVFNILSGHSAPDEKLQKVAYSPVNLRKTLEKNIDREIEFAKKGKNAEIFFKVNSLSDIGMVNKIYEAAKAGVKCYIICRGVCSLVPKKNIFIKSIVGRFLEHSRIYYFSNGKNPEYYISSADLLTRNLDRRVEILINLKDSQVIKKLEWIVSIFKRDKFNSFIMTEDGDWIVPKGDFDAHDWFIKYSDIKKTKKSWQHD